MKIEGNTFKAALPVEEIERPPGVIYTNGDTLSASTFTSPTPIRRRRSTARRAWGPFARFFLRHLFRGMNR